MRRGNQGADLFSYIKAIKGPGQAEYEVLFFLSSLVFLTAPFVFNNFKKSVNNKSKILQDIAIQQRY
jgi:hypothetical protein